MQNKIWKTKYLWLEIKTKKRIGRKSRKMLWYDSLEWGIATDFVRFCNEYSKQHRTVVMVLVGLHVLGSTFSYTNPQTRNIFFFNSPNTRHSVYDFFPLPSFLYIDIFHKHFFLSFTVSLSLSLFHTHSLTLSANSFFPFLMYKCMSMSVNEWIYVAGFFGFFVHCCANVERAPICPIEYFPIIHSGAIGFW